MRIGLYGMPSCGKSYILNKIHFMDVLAGSRLLRETDPDFDKRTEEERDKIRKALAARLTQKKEFIMDGHYAFGDKTVFTEEDGRLYDAFLYLYTAPEVLTARMKSSSKNSRYLQFDAAAWQQAELQGLRDYCHRHNKDFYVLDHPPEYAFGSVDDILSFVRSIKDGYSCLKFAKECADHILAETSAQTVTLLDGDRTLTMEDSSRQVFGYQTCLYDGNFYTGYQAWKQSMEFRACSFPELTEVPVHFNKKVLDRLCGSAYILTSGHEKVWRYLSQHLDIPCFFGSQMSAETKYFITKYLQESGRHVTAYGDGLNDYYMLRQADKGYLVTRTDATVSRSLKHKDLEGLIFV